MKRRQYALQEGEVCKYLTFVSTGLLKSFKIDEKGNERISLFACEGWWISDFNSFIHQEPAVLTIDAIEASELLQISRANYERLLRDVPIMERYFRILYQNSLVTKDKRLISSNSDTAEIKYQRMLETMPDIVQRVPQHLIASYLGLAPETISRIKNKP
ncbi:Crp/Fnr family transcriptional regulator [Sphingobacterium sp. lm-10]|uniref:Crp/Fnr family transcriptional regulator n=1 Tax=Sphingobacterium sp. lm-10 TaxID=2944904 RepID=UPI002021915C|nr:Crp/Fnr family transcriptional regulator [Sphingobacterium sp. lm-10]MCL7986857.1 Crp/Fnr family transcriptional regulator [Sphingobacterium sp. lm-10]